MKFKPIHDGIFFTFIDDADALRGFRETTSWGFQTIAHHSTASKYARWGKVIAVGHEVTDCVVGDEVLIEPMMWTNKATVDGVGFWKTDQTKLLAVR